MQMIDRIEPMPRSRMRMPVDMTLFVVTLALVVIGLWMVFDTSFSKALDSQQLGHDLYHYLRRQAGAAGVGLMLMLILMRFGYWNLKRLAIPAMVLGAVLLLAVFIPHIGHVENQAARWIKLGPAMFQASELAKLALILYTASYLARPHCNPRQIGERGLAPLLFVGMIYIVLIEREPDLGTAVVLFLTFMTQLFLGGARKRHLALILVICAVGVAALGFGFGHRGGRVTTFFNPDKDVQGIGYQLFHARLAVGSGELLGMGFGQGREKYFLPQANSDFIFATYAEELGLAGSLLMLTLQCLVSWRGFRIASQTRDQFGSLLAGGIAALMSWQALINLGTATGSIPATGVTLPFISNGATSLILLMTSVGILLNIAQHPTAPPLSEFS